MTTQMQNLMSRVDGVTADIAPISILEPPATRGAQTAREARRRSAQARRRRREARNRAGVLSGRVPRAIEALAFSETGDMHTDLLAAGLL